MTIAQAGIAATFDLLFPVTCLGCETRGEWFCGRCHVVSQLTALPNACVFCNRVARHPGELCGRDQDRTHLTGLVSYGDYHAVPLATAIAAVKYDGVFAGLPALAQRARERWAALAAARPTVVIPIPLARARERERGFNQAELLARALATQLAIPMSTRLVRTRETPRQVGLGRPERARNVAEAFRWQGQRLTGTVVLVDDVVTTGATLASAARALRAAGANQVWGVSLAVER